MFRISLTISGLASVDTSPSSSLFEIALSTRRMILPERVFGMSGTITTPLINTYFETIQDLEKLVSERCLALADQREQHSVPLVAKTKPGETAVKGEKNAGG